MNLTPIGAKAATLGERERNTEGQMILHGRKNISQFTNGVCYDTVAYARYMLGAKITPKELADITSQAWRAKFKFETSPKWNGKAEIPAGTAVGFHRPIDNNVFHAALAVGGTSIRAVNGGKLGAGWQPVNLKTVLGDPNPDGTFNYDNTTINVFLSRL